MQIHISLSQVEPPAGTVWLQPCSGPCEGQPCDEVPFIGWLGLIRVLSHLIGPPRDPRDSA